MGEPDSLEKHAKYLPLGGPPNGKPATVGGTPQRLETLPLCVTVTFFSQTVIKIIRYYGCGDTIENLLPILSSIENSLNIFGNQQTLQKEGHADLNKKK